MHSYDDYLDLFTHERNLELAAYIQQVRDCPSVQEIIDNAPIDRRLFSDKKTKWSALKLHLTTYLCCSVSTESRVQPVPKPRITIELIARYARLTSGLRQSLSQWIYLPPALAIGFEGDGGLLRDAPHTEACLQLGLIKFLRDKYKPYGDSLLLVAQSLWSSTGSDLGSHCAECEASLVAPLFGNELIRKIAEIKIRNPSASQDWRSISEECGYIPKVRNTRTSKIAYSLFKTSKSVAQKMGSTRDFEAFREFLSSVHSGSNNINSLSGDVSLVARQTTKIEDAPITLRNPYAVFPVDKSLERSDDPPFTLPSNLLRSKLCGAKLIEFVLEEAAKGTPETSICIRSGYNVDFIGSFRQAFARAAGVSLAPLHKMLWKYLQNKPDAETEYSALLISRERRDLATSILKRSSTFRSHVIEYYPCECAFCSISEPALLEAAHVVPVANGGSDLPSNGILLCPTHHKAFDVGLIAIDPNSLRIVIRRGLSAQELGVTKLHAPHRISVKAVKVRFAAFDERDYLIA